MRYREMKTLVLTYDDCWSVEKYNESVGLVQRVHVPVVRALLVLVVCALSVLVLP